VVVTAGAISRAKLQSNHHHQQTNTTTFYRPDTLLSSNSVKALKGNDSTGITRMSWKLRINSIISMAVHVFIDIVVLILKQLPGHSGNG